MKEQHNTITTISLHIPECSFYNSPHCRHSGHIVSHPDNTVWQLVFSGEFSFGDDGNNYPVERDFLLKRRGAGTDDRQRLLAPNPDLSGSAGNAAGTYFFAFGGGSLAPAE